MAKKSARKSKATKPTVHIGAERLEDFKKAAHEAGLAKKFKSAAGKTKEAVFVQVDRENFHKLKKLAEHKDLVDHPAAKEFSDCDCDPKDPFCICT